MRWSCLALAAALLSCPAARAAEGPEAKVERLERRLHGLELDLDRVRKLTDDVLWFQRLSDVAEVDKVTLVGPPDPRAKEEYGIRNERHPMKIHQYVFVPRQLDRQKKHPLVVLPHGGVHGDFGTYHVHIVRELVAQGYVVVAPEYRGSTGYGRGYLDAIDYGGLEVDDVVAGRDWAVEMLPVDPGRCALVGWSHGGLIALLAAFDHPDKFAAVFAGVPVSDLLARVGYAGEEYRDDAVVRTMFAGKTPNEDVELVRRRSPVWNVERLRIPLLIHGTTNDRDVNVVEVESLVNALKAAGKPFEHRIWKDAPGGHSFERIDTAVAREARKELYAFLARHLR